MKWYINRLKLMSFKEIIFFRMSQQFQYLFLGKRHQNIKFTSENINVNKNIKRNNYSKLGVEKFINKDFNEDEYSFFDIKINVFKPIKWLKDYKNNIESTKCYYAKINKQEFKTYGDIKYVFEPSRFYFLPFLAIYAIDKCNEKHLNVIQDILVSWDKANPYLNSIHWTSGIEVAIRSINLIYTHEVLSASNKLTPRIDQLIKKLILYNYHFLKHHLSLYSSANNHLVAELSGLVVISTYFDNKEINKTREKWINRLYDEILNQVNGDGVNMELSTHYHAEVTDHFFNALHFISKCKINVPKNVEERFKKMFNFLNHVQYNNVNTIFGDNDEGFLLNPYFDRDFSIYNSLLISASTKYNMSYNLRREFDLRNYLIFGDEFEVKNLEPNIYKDRIFNSSGYAFLYDNANRVKVAFDFGDIGDHISAAHGHSDIFHFTLDIDGIPILVDSGTYQYHSIYAKWREYFRSVSAHNTISVNGIDHAKQNSRMSWISKPKVTLNKYKLSQKCSFIDAETDAFKKENIIHGRKLLFNKKNQNIKIFDKLNFITNNTESRMIYFYLNFGNELQIVHNHNEIIIKIGDNDLSIRNSKFNKGFLSVANENNVLGWRSNNYGTKSKGHYFLLKLELNESEELITEINY